MMNTDEAVAAGLSEAVLDSLRARVAGEMSEKRFRHTCGVERMVARLCALYCPENTLLLRAAALLHDLTKEKSLAEQLQLCREFDIMVTSCDVLAPKTFHARTAAALIPRDFPSFACPMVVSAVRYHTTGREGMTLTEQLLYLADYIDDTRTFADCVTLRERFFDAMPEKMNGQARREHLRKIMILSYDMTVRGLLEEGGPVSIDTMAARNDLILQAASV